MLVPCTYKFSRYVNIKDATNSAFHSYIFKDHQPFKNSQISLALLNKCAAHMTTHLATSFKNAIKKSTFGDTSPYVWSDVSKLPPEYINWAKQNCVVQW